ncbi:MAG TPA: hypothetical protein VEN81_01885 [Planctomycetota bacterium]|nr:hypothetical protein [Planctomycetota bacterium]
MKTRYQLGAEELIELGRGETSPRPDRKPFFLGRVRLSDGREGASSYLQGRLNLQMGLLERLMGPESLPEVMRRAPALREVAARTLIAGGAVMPEGLSGVGHALGHVLEAIEATGSPEENAGLVEAAARQVAGEAPAQMRSSVEEILNVR